MARRRPVSWDVSLGRSSGLPTPRLPPWLAGSYPLHWARAPHFTAALRHGEAGCTDLSRQPHDRETEAPRRGALSRPFTRPERLDCMLLSGGRGGVLSGSSSRSPGRSGSRNEGFPQPAGVPVPPPPSGPRASATQAPWPGAQVHGGALRPAWCPQLWDHGRAPSGGKPLCHLCVWEEGATQRELGAPVRWPLCPSASHPSPNTGPASRLHGHLPLVVRHWTGLRFGALGAVVTNDRRPDA